MAPDVEVLGSRYEVVRTVSVGQRATVLQALDRQHEKLVAVKVYSVTGDADREELLAEARVLLSITPHPALPIVRADFFTDDDERYVVVMDWVDGVDLQQLLDDEGDPGLPLSQVLDDVAQAAAALDHLHGHEPPIVHGDVKPANLVRTPAGKIVLVDFDIASAQSALGRVGTRGYAAPEVAAGEKPGPAADVYGLAATVWTLLNGQLPSSERSVWPGIDPAETGALARALRSALSVNPATRPASAGKLVERLRGGTRADLPRGVVTLLATEVADAGRLWDEEAEDMRAAMSRLNDLVSSVVESRGGRIVSSMNEGDRTIAVFKDGSAAAGAALTLQDRVGASGSGLGLDVRLRVALEVGEVDLVDGVYSGAPVDRVLWLRSIAAPGATITSQSSGELLRDGLDDDVRVIGLATVATRARPRGTAVCALARAGQEHTGRLDADVIDDLTPPSPAPEPAKSSFRRQLMADAIQYPPTLIALTAAGFALIYLLVLGPELGGHGLAIAVLVIAAVTALGSFGWRYSVGYGEEEARREIEELERQEAEATQKRDAEVAENRRMLAQGFARIGSDAGSRTLAGLTDQFDTVLMSLRSERDGGVLSFVHILPGLADETYATGLSALTQALGLLEVADSPKRRRLERELDEIIERLENAVADDARERERDERRKVSREETLAALDELRNGARELLYQAERCELTLHNANIELASVRAGSARVSVDSVIETLQENIRRVREVQEELRKLQY